MLMNGQSLGKSTRNIAVAHSDNREAQLSQNNNNNPTEKRSERSGS